MPTFLQSRVELLQRQLKLLNHHGPLFSKVVPLTLSVKVTLWKKGRGRGGGKKGERGEEGGGREEGGKERGEEGGKEREERREKRGK